MANHFSLMIHGGAGTLAHVRSSADAAPYLNTIHATLDQGRRILARGGAALDAVEICCALLEDDPLLNAGRGSVLNAEGRIEMDAGIMDGATLNAGAVAAVHHIARPIALARLVMARSGHVLLGGEGAMAFADACGVARVPDAYLITEARQGEWARTRAAGGAAPAPDGVAEGHGTVGAVARDRSGNLAAATSTGGLVNKHPGRIGDSPIIGAGVYADNETCAVSATGRGEDLLRTVMAKTIADLIELRGLDAAQAVAAGMAYLRRKVEGHGGVIVVDRIGRCAAGFTTPRLIHGWIECGGASQARI
jgi:beta-aspartyl-peptidase (threonine type)